MFLDLMSKTSTLRGSALKSRLSHELIHEWILFKCDTKAINEGIRSKHCLDAGEPKHCSSMGLCYKVKHVTQPIKS